MEIDTYATHAKHELQVPDDKLIVLRLMQTGSNWTKTVTAKTGRTDEEEADTEISGAEGFAWRQRRC